MYTVLVSWSTWSDVCDFLIPHAFVGGVFLDEQTDKILPEGASSAKMGVLVKTTTLQEKLIKEGEMIWYESTGWYMVWDNERHGMDYFAFDLK